MTNYSRCPDCGRFAVFVVVDGGAVHQPHQCDPENRERNNPPITYRRPRPMIDIDPQPEIHPGELLGDWTDRVQVYWRDRGVET